MPVTTALFASVAILVIGTLIYWSNPVRLVNQTVLSCTLHLTAWLGCLHLAFTAQPGLLWLRWTCAIGALLPVHFYLVKEGIATGFSHMGKPWIIKVGLWFAACVALASLCFTELFIPSHSTGTNRIYGAGYYGYIIALFGLYGVLLRDAAKDLRSLSGGQRLELQVWLGGGGATAVTILGLMSLGLATHSPIYVRLQPLAVLLFYAGTSYAITTRRIFDARQIVLIGLDKTILVAVVASFAYLLDALFDMLLPAPLAMLITTAVALWFAAFFSGWLDRIFNYYPQATAARQAAFSVSRVETQIEDLESKFVELVKGWGQTEHAIILIDAKASLPRKQSEMAEDSEFFQTMRQLRWSTPERLARERSTPGRRVVERYMREQDLGVIVIGDGSTLSVVVGAGLPATRRPFTYPQVTQLMELAAIIESALERAHFSVKAQRAEQLATVGLLGASMAHEIRNPLVTIKTFVQLLPKHYQDPVFREKFFSLIGDEVTRIDRLTEQLLDLASPRAYQAKPTELHPVLRASVELVAAKANDKRIRFLTELSAKPDLVLTDASAAKQVLLNLCFNAIQAVEKLDGDRWVKVSTHNVGDQVEMVVEDNGPGIAPEIRPRLFEPFQSTKSSGFGLGLAICSDILVGLEATIAVDPAEPGRGATFRVQFPCPV